MSDKVISNGLEYNVSITMYSMKMHEKAKGLKLSQIGESLANAETEMDSFILMSELCYYGAKDFLETQGKEIEVSEQQFVRGIKLDQMSVISNVVMDYFGEIKEAENKRQPKAKKV